MIQSQRSPYQNNSVHNQIQQNKKRILSPQNYPVTYQNTQFQKKNQPNSYSKMYLQKKMQQNTQKAQAQSCKQSPKELQQPLKQGQVSQQNKINNIKQNEFQSNYQQFKNMQQNKKKPLNSVKNLNFSQAASSQFLKSIQTPSTAGTSKQPDSSNFNSIESFLSSNKIDKREKSQSNQFLTTFQNSKQSSDHQQKSKNIEDFFDQKLLHFKTCNIINSDSDQQQQQEKQISNKSESFTQNAKSLNLLERNAQNQRDESVQNQQQQELQEQQAKILIPQKSINSFSTQTEDKDKSQRSLNGDVLDNNNNQQKDSKNYESNFTIGLKQALKQIQAKKSSKNININNNNLEENQNQNYLQNFYQEQQNANYQNIDSKNPYLSNQSSSESNQQNQQQNDFSMISLKQFEKEEQNLQNQFDDSPIQKNKSNKNQNQNEIIQQQSQSLKDEEEKKRLQNLKTIFKSLEMDSQNVDFADKNVLQNLKEHSKNRYQLYANLQNQKNNRSLAIRQSLQEFREKQSSLINLDFKFEN